MKPEEIAASMSEPACAHNKTSKSGCAKPAPGATQGGCCFDGANALPPIADVGMAHCLDGARPGLQSDGGDLECPGMRGQRIDRPLTVVPVTA